MMSEFSKIERTFSPWFFVEYPLVLRSGLTESGPLGSWQMNKPGAIIARKSWHLFG
jgi:hypothetical protein